MILRITKAIYDTCREAMSAPPFHIRPTAFDDGQVHTLHLERYTPDALARLRAVIAQSDAKGVGKLVTLLKEWERATTVGEDLPRCKVMENAPYLIKARLAQFPLHRVFEYRDENVSSSAEQFEPVPLAYYVEEIEHVAANSYHHTPEEVRVSLAYRYLGNTRVRTVVLYAGQVLGKTADEMLAEIDLHLESPDLTAAYNRSVGRYLSLKDRVGLKLMGVGIADAGNLDSATTSKRGDWWGESARQWWLSKDGRPTPLVVDVRYESDGVPREHDHHVSMTFWSDKIHLVNRSQALVHEDDKDVNIHHQIPIHPYLIVYDLKAYRRVCVHVDNVTEYQYDTKIREKLILDERDSDFIDILLHNPATFQDVIPGKSGGTIVMLQGIPGTGKTLTVEVCSEEMQRVLYSVQCSQLGTDAETIEEALNAALDRVVRWNGIMLLDEADVFVMERGADMNRNAIVGVFLRVLERFSGTLFLTTNMLNAIDDAVASRCVARITYDMPAPDKQEKIWRVLLSQNGIELSDEGIAEIVAQYPMTGRDIKQTIKLGQAVCAMKKSPFNVETVKFVARFKPDAHVPADERIRRMSRIGQAYSSEIGSPAVDDCRFGV